MQLRTADARQLITMLGMVILKVRQAQHCDRDELARMRVLLWPDRSFEEHLTELDAALSHRVSGTLPVTILVSQNENAALLGFIEVGLRSHADGCDQ
jgi:aminoglycoside 6'-N-acetyltransferase I